MSPPLSEPIRYRLTVEYDGGAYCGWQRQKDCLTVQEVLEKGLRQLFGHPVELLCAGRTDKGVHATGQVAHFDAWQPRSPETIVRAVNALSPSTVAVLAATRVSTDFHARYSATYREYLYRLLDRRLVPSALDRDRVWCTPGRTLDAERMRQAGATLMGTHDFSAFRAAGCQAKHPIRTVQRLELLRRGEELHLIMGANAFLYHMVRNVVGTLVQVGQGRWSADRFQEVFQSLDRRNAGPTAPPQGLYLTRVEYPQSL
ncbi:MAG: tRNA pseudouridine(38-40) synthase TruA [Magnetococcales bacterium]|nr:tRNA pseudouridine(38-40) synthase TruA [Magnetococcales bacterium]